MYDSIESLYDHLEKQAFDYKYMVGIGDLFQKLRDQFHKEGNEGKALLAQYEIDAFNLMVKDGRLVAQFVGTNESGQEVQIPDMKGFSEEELDYFVERLKDTKNPRLKARYAHILWESTRKSQQYADAAIEGYLEQTPFYEKQNNLKQDDDIDSHDFYFDIFECISSAFYLAISSKMDVAKVVSVIWSLIHDLDKDNVPKFTYSNDLITLVINNKKHFESQNLSCLSGICLTKADQLENKGDLHGAIIVNELGSRVDIALQLETADWNKRIAFCYEKLMEKRKKSPMVASEWCQRAIDFYKKAGEKAKVEKLTLIREKLGSEMQFQSVSTQIDQTNHIAWCEQVGEEISKKTTDEILAFIAGYPILLPLKNDMELTARETAQVTPFLSLVKETILDDRMHVTEHPESTEEKLKRGILEAFNMCLNVEKIPLINAIINRSVREGKLDTDKVIKALVESSWIGAKLKSQRGSSKDYSYCWIDLIRPSIQSYFSYMTDMLERNEPDEPPIMAIDSLTTKFEGLIRDYAQLNGIITCYDTKDNAGRTVTREKDLTLLLYDPRIAKLFNADDLLFFRFMFIEHSGFTLRHRVSHGLMQIEDYNFGILQLLFVALMRLAKYPVRSKKPE